MGLLDVGPEAIEQTMSTTAPNVDTVGVDGRRTAPTRREILGGTKGRKSDTDMTHAYEGSPRCERRGRKRTGIICSCSVDVWQTESTFLDSNLMATFYLIRLYLS